VQFVSYEEYRTTVNPQYLGPFGDVLTHIYLTWSGSSQRFTYGFILRIHSEPNLVCAFGSGVRGSVVVKALCYKSEGRGFETR
jgi:hypothetical protein